jgi:hypothetical protein
MTQQNEEALVEPSSFFEATGWWRYRMAASRRWKSIEPDQWQRIVSQEAESGRASRQRLPCPKQSGGALHSHGGSSSPLELPPNRAREDARDELESSWPRDNDERWQVISSHRCVSHVQV